MKLLFDQNLSYKLPARLADIFPESAHIRLLGMDGASDTVIWQYARDNNFAIVTQDSDFAERSKLFGAPPLVVWLRCGNTTPQRVEAILRANVLSVQELTSAGSGPFIELF